MGSTILTVIVLVVMWVVVLVPMFTRRHEEAEASVGERLGGAVRVLSRRAKPAPHVTAAVAEEADPVEATEPSDPPESSAEPEYDAELSEEDSEPPMTIERPMPTARAQMLARRRRTLGTIIMLAIMTALLAAGWRPRIWVVQIGLDVLLVGYLWWLRQEVRRERARRARRAARSARGERVARPAGRDRLPGHPRRAPVDESVAEQAEAAEEVDDGRWEPRPVPTPTYLQAAVHEPRRAYVENPPQHEVVALDDQDPELSYDFDDYPTAEIESPPRAVNG